jgi:hypothetical protein
MQRPITNHSVSPVPSKEVKKHKKALNAHLKEFFKLLDSRPKPTTETIRAEFIRHEAEWHLYCAKHRLGARLAELFNANVSLEWERKYTAQQNQ